MELKPWGIWVAVVEPGVVDTPLREKTIATLRRAREGFPPEAHELYGHIFGSAERQQERGIPAERVAEAVEHALFSRSPKRRYLVGPDAIVFSIFRKLPVAFRDWLIARHIETHHGPQSKPDLESGDG